MIQADLESYPTEKAANEAIEEHFKGIPFIEAHFDNSNSKWYIVQKWPEEKSEEE